MPVFSPTAAAEGPGSPARQLQDALLETENVEKFLQELIGLAVHSIGGDLSAGVTVHRDGHPTTVASSDERAAQYDEIQYGFDDGPCLTAMRANKVVIVDDLEHDERFGPYRTRAVALGVRSSLSLPLDGGAECIGALNLYSRRTHAFGERAQAEAKRFTDEASRALTLAARIAHHVEITDQLRAALNSRAVIDQAMGVIMAQNRCDADRAFAMLRTASQGRNVKLRIVAAEIVQAVSNKPPVDGRPFVG